MNRNAVATVPVAEARPVREAGLQVRFLDGSNPGDLRAWQDQWERWPDREVSAHPAYVRLFVRPGDEVVCAAAPTPSGGVLYPVIVRPLEREEWSGRTEGGCDLTTAYGYGGPFAWNVGEPEAAAFWEQFDAWAERHGVVTSFARLSLFPKEMLPFHGETVARGPNVVRRLDLPEAEIWGDYQKKVRVNVRRARSEGVTIQRDLEGRRMGEFMSVYEATMDRRNALEEYYFPRRFFESIVGDLAGHFFLIHALKGGRVISSKMVLLSAGRAYFFLGGTLTEAFPMRPNDLLMHETILFCRELGKSSIVLGGGYRTNDGILRFKRSFAPEGDVPFYVGHRTYDSGRASELVERRAAWERREGRTWNPEPGYFPAYRSRAAAAEGGAR